MDDQTIDLADVYREYCASVAKLDAKKRVDRVDLEFQELIWLGIGYVDTRRIEETVPKNLNGNFRHGDC